MPELQHQGSSRLLNAPGSTTSSTTATVFFFVKWQCSILDSIIQRIFFFYQIKAGLAPPDDSVAGLASSFKDKVKIEKKHGTGENQPDQKKKVKVEEGGKIKSTGGKINKKTSQTATLVR